jgi:hypothetical protein
MSNYERNNTMVACIIGSIIIAAALLGVMAFLNPWLGPGNTDVNWGDENWTETIEYNFELTDASVPASLSLLTDLDVGAVNVVFINESDLVYRIDMIVPNQTVIAHGAPIVAYAGGIIDLTYPVAGVNVTLGSAAYYSMDLTVTTGAVNIEANEIACIDDITVDVTTGAIGFELDNGTLFEDDITVDLSVVTGAIGVFVTLNTTIGGHFSGSTTTGHVDVTPTGWSLVSGDIYATANYATALQTVTITAEVVTGGISATLEQV